eukprot:jgi/Bigna1/83639/fgenesh1_pg.112_\
MSSTNSKAAAAAALMETAPAVASSLTIYRGAHDDEGRSLGDSSSFAYSHNDNDSVDDALFGAEDIIHISAPDTSASLNRRYQQKSSSSHNYNYGRHSMANHDQKEFSSAPSSSLPLSSSSSSPPSSSSMWLGWGYLLMCCAFAATQGSASATIALGVAYAGDLGSMSAGIVFACHTLTSLLLAPGVAQRLGGKVSLLIGSSLMTLYVISYFSLHSNSEALYRPLIIVGSLLGGVGTGLIWIAQGVYMTRIVREHAARTGIFAPKLSVSEK